MSKSAFRLGVAAALAMALHCAFAAAPAWWSERGVIPAQDGEITDAMREQNYNTANLGQLKHMNYM